MIIVKCQLNPEDDWSKLKKKNRSMRDTYQNESNERKRDKVKSKLHI